MANRQKPSDPKSFRLWFPLRGAGRTFDILASSAVINILSLAMPLALLQIYDRIIPNAAAETLVAIVLLVGIALVLEFILRACRTVVTTWMAARFEHAVGCRAIRHLLEADLAAFEAVGAGVHMQRLNAVGTLREFYGGQAMQVICDLPFAALFIGIVAYLAGPLALVPVVVFLLFTGTAALAARRMQKALAQRNQADDRRYNFLMEVLSGAHTVKALALENQILRRYERLQATSAEAHHGVAVHGASALGLGAMFSQVMLFSVVGVGAIFVIEGALSVGALAACTMLSSRAMQPLQRAVGIWARFQTIRLARRQVQDVFDLPAEAASPRDPVPALRGAIDLDAVTFRFPQGRTDVLRDVSLTIAAGETVAITGDSASGKTTLLHLMSGLLTPTAGTARIDDRDVTTLDPAGVRAQVAYLPQRPVLFDGTIRENLTMFRPHLDAAALKIAEITGLDDDVALLPMGYETRIGDGAAQVLAHGVAQQIAIVRAFTGRPRIMLFDEANVALDRTHDALLRHVLQRLHGHWTLVMVTHRPSMLAIADRVFRIVDGTLVTDDRARPRSVAASGPAPSRRAC